VEATRIHAMLREKLLAAAAQKWYFSIQGLQYSYPKGLVLS